MKKEYDIIIVGAGVSGLVCGCYLAKAGKKVLILEKNTHPGGCCTTFEKDGFQFDSAAHSLGGMSKNGPIGGILTDLGITNFSVKRTNPSYILTINNLRIRLWNDVDAIINELETIFPSEKSSIKNFFSFIKGVSVVGAIKLKNVKFGDLVGKYITNKKIKGIILAPLLGNTGVDPKNISAFTAVKFYQQYVLDGGYHFDAGMQVLPDILAKKFCEYGGVIKFSSEVTNIVTQNFIVKGVQTFKNKYVAEIVVSNIDSKKTFLKLVGRKEFKAGFLNKLKSLNPSSSMFMLYIGLKNRAPDVLEEGVTHWFVTHFNIDNVYRNIEKDNLRFNWIAIRVLKGRKSLQVFTIAPLKNKEYWRDRKNIWKRRLYTRAKKHIPLPSSNIELMLSGDPQTVLNWTGNHLGAACGWQSLPDQFAVSELSQRTCVKNLFLTGHWTTITLGLPGVANIGRSTARLILDQYE